MIRYFHNDASSVYQITKKSRSRFELAWELESRDIGEVLQPPEGVLTYGVCLIFMADKPNDEVLSNFVPSHEDNPKVVLLNDTALQDWRGTSSRLGNMERGGHTKRCWAAKEEVAFNEDPEKMWRLASLGWQAREKGKGDDVSLDWEDAQRTFYHGNKIHD
jgi:hypothetical protein